jgi:mercuric ion binding protein
MKTLKLLILSSILLSVSTTGFTQTKTEKFNVAGECGTCKKKIEAAAKKAGATYAAWNVDTKELTVTYSNSSSNTAKIQKTIAGAGYDTPGFKATNEAYNKLDNCCKYPRTAAMTSKDCCNDQKCTDQECMKDGKCTKDMSYCKDSSCNQKECCKKS